MSHCDERFGLDDLYSSTLGINKIITDWLNAGGQIGVGCFVLISGYFMIEQRITVKKILTLASEVWFYSITFLIIWLITKSIQEDISTNEIIRECIYSLFPILFSSYWFVTTYIILIILSPFINKFLLSLDKKQYQYLLICLIAIFVIFDGAIPNTLNGIADGRFFPVLLIYIIAGYIKRFRVTEKHNAMKYFSIAFMLYVILLISFYLITYIGVIFDKKIIMDLCYFYRSLNSPLVVVICVSIFLGVLDIHIPNNCIINEIAKSTFGVYLIHGNRLVKPFISYCFPIYRVTNSFGIFVYSVIGVITIYVICTLIDFARNKTIGKLWNELLDKYLPDIVDKSQYIIEKIVNIF